jgi:RNA polymerase sigma-70 factor, ECF subfamily
LFTGAAGGLLAAHLPGLSDTPAVAVLMAALAVSRVTVMSRQAEPGLDPESRGWVDGLRPAAAERDAVLARLHGLLLRVARQEAGRRNGWLRLSGPDSDDLARQAASDALTAVTVQLHGFHGQSTFSSWASKFAVFGVAAAAGRQFWQTRTLPLDQEDWDRLPFGRQPHDRAERNELVPALRRAVDEDLSGEQRTVFTAVTLHRVPAAALAAALGSDRNAIYKALFEARRILRARLAATGKDLAHLPGAPWAGPPWLDDLLAADPGDAGCDVAFHVLDRYAEAELNGTSPESRFPGSGRAPALLRCLPSGLPGAAGRRGRTARPARLRGDQRADTDCRRRLWPLTPCNNSTRRNLSA